MQVAKNNFFFQAKHMTTKMGHYVISLARKLDQVQSVLTLCYFCQTLLTKKHCSLALNCA